MIWVMPSASTARVAGSRSQARVPGLPPHSLGCCIRPTLLPWREKPAQFNASRHGMHHTPWTQGPPVPIFPARSATLNDQKDEEQNRLSARAARYVRVGTNVGAVAARVAGQRLLGLEADSSKNAAALAAALGGLKGPIMKVAQMLATIPEALPAEYANELSQLQSQAPPMGPAFVRRRMLAELG